MPDRILRDEIWESDRFLDLPSDTHRLAFVRFVNLADDFGNFEGGQRRIYRILHSCTQVKTIEATSLLLEGLIDCDLLRRYEVDDRELFHLPRLRPHRQYLVRKVPASPWCQEVPLGKDQRVYKQGIAKNVVTTSHARSNDVAQGVGVGVEVGVDVEKKNLMSGKPDLAAQSLDILKYLNAITGHHFQPWKSSLNPILARLKEGYSPARLREIAFLKTEQWGKDEKMMEYLRPITLYAAKNCAAYDGVLPNGVDDVTVP